jgi:hypothetical protein
VRLSRVQVAQALAVMTVASATGGILFNLTTNGNAQLLTERFAGVMSEPARLGLLWASVYAFASLAQVVVGHLIFIFGAIPFTDAMIVRYVDDAMRSRVAGVRLAVSLGSARWRCGCSARC